MHHRFAGFVLLLLWPLGCSSTTSGGSADEPGPTATTRPSGQTSTQMNIQSELGALDEEAVHRILGQVKPKLDECMDKSREQLPIVGGTIKLLLRIGSEGQVRWSYVSESKLGDHLAEECILEALRSPAWPVPVGGRDGQITQGYNLGEPDARPPVPWTRADLGRRFKPVEAKIRKCQQAAGTGPVQVTLYVDPDGRAESVGVAVSDEHGSDAIACVVKAVKSARLPSPGSYSAKVTVDVK